MKIKSINATYEQALAVKPSPHFNPKRPSLFWRTMVRLVGLKELKATAFTYIKNGMEKLGSKEPCLVLMNHSAFIDLSIASKIFYPRPYNIVCTSDGFVGKEWLMRRLGCIPTKKFVTDFQLVKDIFYAVRKLHNSVLMYPEASYSFDGTATPLPQGIGKLIKKLEVPIVMIKTHGAFQHDPLYNGLRLRKVKVSADVDYLLSPEDCKEKSVEEINSIVQDRFTFDNFQWQIQNHVKVDEPFRGEGLNRVLFKCPHCNAEGKMVASGTSVKCSDCGKEYELTEYGAISAKDGETEFDSVPKWYQWERDCVKKELENGSYKLDIPVSISMLRDTKHLFNIGEGRLVHSPDGFHLTGCNGMLDFKTTPFESYSLYSDYFWYEIGDVICIGNQNVLYYCFPKNCGDVVSKTRLAAEELYKICKA